VPEERRVTLLINRAVTRVKKGLNTWGDLIAFVDANLAPTGHVVTDVRLNGVDEPAFRDPGLGARPLACFTDIAIETGPPAVLARRCLVDAADALTDLRQATRDAADGFRSDAVDEARRGLEEVSQGLLVVVRIVAAAGLALRSEIEATDSTGRSISSLSVELDSVIRDLVEGQQNEDWLQVADILEHDLDPMLKGWHSVLTHVAAA
jgi:hypothetical protein